MELARGVRLRFVAAACAPSKEKMQQRTTAFKVDRRWRVLLCMASLKGRDWKCDGKYRVCEKDMFDREWKMRREKL